MAQRRDARIDPEKVTMLEVIRGLTFGQLSAILAALGSIASGALWFGQQQGDAQESSKGTATVSPVNVTVAPQIQQSLPAVQSGVGATTNEQVGSQQQEKRNSASGSESLPADGVGTNRGISQERTTDETTESETANAEDNYKLLRKLIKSSENRFTGLAGECFVFNAVRGCFEAVDAGEEELFLSAYIGPGAIHPMNVVFDELTGLLRKAIEPSWSVVTEDMQRTGDKKFEVGTIPLRRIRITLKPYKDRLNMYWVSVIGYGTDE